MREFFMNVKSMDLELCSNFSFTSYWLCDLWENYITFLRLSFLICEMVM